ncbi:hypothetical protein pb186bvf_017748 [Paramecium bursaria]
MKEDKQFDAKKQLIQLGQTVLEKIYHILINSTEKSLIDKYRIQDIRNSFLNNYKIIPRQLMELNALKHLVMIQMVKVDLSNKIQKFFIDYKGSLVQGYNTTIQKQRSFQAVQNIQANYPIARLIAGQQFTRQKLDEFLQLQQYIVFEIMCDFNSDYLQGLSSFDGKIVYIHKEYSEDFFISEPNMAKKELIWLIEYQLMENLSRWQSNSHILSISAERNKNLKSENNEMVGSGSFYKKKAYKFYNGQENPFYINHKFQHRISDPYSKQIFR